MKFFVNNASYIVLRIIIKQHIFYTACGISAGVVAAVDINTTANQVYSHNFPETVLLNRNIEVLIVLLPNTGY